VKKIKILFTTPILEHPAAGGPQLRIENSIKALAKVSNLYVISQVSADRIGKPDDVSYVRKLSDHFCYTPSASLKNNSKSLFSRIKKRLFPKPNKSLFDQDIDFFYNYIKKYNINIIWFGYGCISFPIIKKLRELLPNIKCINDTDSVWSRFILRELDVEKDPKRREEIEKEGKAKETEEKENSSICDVTTAVSEVDASYYRSISPDTNRVHIFSNVIDLETYKNPVPPPPDFKTPALFLGGSFYSEHSPMVHAANWVIKEIMPIVWEKYPQVHVYIVGRGGEEQCSSLLSNNVTITGKVASVLPYLRNSVCSLVPLSFESGTRYKILESGACGIPVVSTTLGAEGIPVKHEHDCLIADTTEDFANAIIKLLNDEALGKKLGNNCLKLIQKDYSVDTLANEAKLILSYLLVGGWEQTV